MNVPVAVQVRTRGEALRQAWSHVPAALETLYLAVHPRTIRKRALAFRHTYYLGTAAASVWLVMIATGLLMMFHVRPGVPEIYRDLQELQFTVEYGPLVRNLHHWGANAMVILVVLHLLRVFFHGAYAPPRRAAWFLGVGLFILTFLSAHTGYLLPWDQRAYWGIVIASAMAEQMPVVGKQIRFLLLGGHTIGENAVLHLYVLHCVLIPAATAVLLGAHLWRIRKTGVQGPGLASQAELPNRPRDWPGGRQEEHVNAFPHLLLRQVLVFQWVVIVLVALALTGDTPLDELANPTETPNPVKAPWHFVGLQELLHYFPTILVGVVVPTLVIGLLVVIPFARKAASPLGLPGIVVPSGVALAILAVTALLAAAQAWVALIPTLIIEALALRSLYAPSRWRSGPGWFHRRSMLDWIVIWFVAVAAAATLTGTFLRGPGWILIWPGSASP